MILPIDTQFAIVRAVARSPACVSLPSPQVYGTQFSRKTGVWTQERYNRALVADALRKVLGVKSQAEQAQQMAKLPGPPPKP